MPTSPTTAAAIRDRIIALIEALIPRELAGDRFVVFRDDDDADFQPWCEANPQAAFRRFQVRDLAPDRPAQVSNMDVEERMVTFTIAIAYPQTARAGRLGARDRDRIRTADRHQIETAIGMRGAANFQPPNPEAGWISSDAEDEPVLGKGVDFQMITQTMRFMLTVS